MFSVKEAVVTMRRVAPMVGVLFGVLLVLSAGILRWGIAPAVAVLPGDTDTTRAYTGTVTMLNAAALTSSTAGPLVLRDLPVGVTHRTKVLDTKGDSALVSDTKTVTASGRTIAASDDRYAVDRTLLTAGSGFTGVVAQRGLTFNWPIRTQAKDYPGWVPDTGRTTTLTYTGKANRGGVPTYVYTAKTAAQPITDQQVLAGLPKGLPKASLASLATGLGLPAATLARLTAVLPRLPDPVPLSYTYQADATYWVAPDSGIVVDIAQHEVRSAVLTLAGTTTPLAAVMDLRFTAPAVTVSQAGKDARDSAKGIRLLYRTLPWSLTVLGFALVVVGLVTRRRGSLRQPPAGSVRPPAPRATPVP